MRRAVCCILALAGAASAAAAQTCGEGRLLSAQDLAVRLGPWTYRRAEAREGPRREVVVSEETAFAPFTSRTDICLKVRSPGLGAGDRRASISLVGSREGGRTSNGTDFLISLGADGRIGLMEHHPPFEERDRTWAAVSERLRTAPADVNEIVIALRDDRVRLTVNGILAGEIRGPDFDPEASWRISLLTETRLVNATDAAEGRNYVLDSATLVAP